MQLRRLRRAPAAFPGDDLQSATLDRADQDRLDQALTADDVDQFRLLAGVEPPSRLAGIGHDARQGDRLAPDAAASHPPRGRGYVASISSSNADSPRPRPGRRRSVTPPP